MSSPTTNLLAGLVQGYVSGKDEQTKQELLSHKETRDSMLQYLGHMVNSPEVPAEHKQWAMQQIPLLAQHDITKKFPKGIGDLSTLPPVTLQRPPTQQSQTLPGNTPSFGPRAALQPPQPPSGGVGSSGAQQPPVASPGDVGRAANGTVNALGQAPPAPGPVARPPLQMPVPPSGLLSQGPQPLPEQLALGGAPHILTLGEKMRIGNAAEQDEVNRLQQQYPEKSREDLLYLAQHGEFPKAETADVAPGAELVDKRTGKVLARNETPRPGAKSGYEPKMGPAGPIGVTDMATGGMLTPDEVAANPHAKAILDQAVKEHKAQLSEQEARDNRKAAVQAAQQARAFAQQARMLEARGEALTANTKAMVEAVPKVQELSQRIRALVDQQEQSLGPMSSRWQEFMAGKIGSPNADFTKLRTDTGLLQTLLVRMHVGARGGQQMIEHFQKLIDSSKQSPENMRAALDEIDSYAADVAKQGVDAKEATAAKAEGRTVKEPKPPTATTKSYTPPANAPRAIGPNGHQIVVDDGKWVDAQTGQPIQ